MSVLTVSFSLPLSFSLLSLWSAITGNLCSLGEEASERSATEQRRDERKGGREEGTREGERDTKGSNSDVRRRVVIRR